MEIFATWFFGRLHLSLAEQAASGVGCGKFFTLGEDSLDAWADVHCAVAPDW